MLAISIHARLPKGTLFCNIFSKYPMPMPAAAYAIVRCMLVLQLQFFDESSDQHRASVGLRVLPALTSWRQ
jgi:hypothetical protein